MELGLEIMEGNETMGYYFVNCDSRVIFWFEDIKSTSLMSNVRGVEHKSHVSQCLPLSHSLFEFLSSCHSQGMQ